MQKLISDFSSYNFLNSSFLEILEKLITFYQNYVILMVLFQEVCERHDIILEICHPTYSNICYM